MSTKKAAELLNVEKHTARVTCGQLRDDGLITSVGQTRSLVWMVVK